MLWTLWGALAVYVAATAWIKLREHSLVFVPYRGPYGALPPDLEPFTRQVSTRTEDGLTLAGYELLVERDPDRAPWLVFLHGNGKHIAVGGRLDRYRQWRRLGFNVLAFDYRGYGESEGTPSEEGFYRDARAIYNHLHRARAIDPKRIVVLGGSLGSAVAVDLAQHVKLAGLILEGAFPSIPEVGQRRYPLLPIRWLMKYRFASIEKIRRISVPMLFLHARSDRVVPPQLGQALFEATAAPKRWIELDGGHDDGHLASATLYERSLQSFVSEVTA
jgi:hypothetical protein